MPERRKYVEGNWSVRQAMKNEMKGVVVGLKGEIATVKLKRHLECAECGSCLGDDAMVMEVLNPVGAAVGQTVVVEVEGDSLLLSAFVVYVLPLLAVVAGCAVGHYASRLMRLGEIMPQALGGLLLFGLSLAYVRRFDNALRARQGMPVIKDTTKG